MKLKEVMGSNSSEVELVQAYLDKAQKIKGLYVLTVGELTQSDMHELLHYWRDFEQAGYIEAPLVIVPNDTMLTHEDRFSFERSMQIVRAGGQVRRLIWNPKHYLFIDDMEEVCLRQSKSSSSAYAITKDDLEAIDWILYEDIAENI